MGLPEGFPDPEKVEILDYTPPIIKAEQKNKIKIEDTFWEGKLKLITNFPSLLKVDNHALKAPAALKRNPAKLVPHLLEATTSAVEKVRVFVRWISDNIAYDLKGRERHNADSSIEGVLKNGKAVCEGYANLLQHFCEFAGIECQIIPGQTKSGDKKDKGVRVVPKADHCWNTVKLDGQWYLLDVTWCSGSYGATEFTKEWREQWFLTDPEVFISSHLPVTQQGTILTDWQLIKQPFQSSEQWDKHVYSSPYAKSFGMEALTYKNTRVTCKEAEIILKFKCAIQDIHFYTMFEKQSGGPVGKKKAAISGKLDNQWRILYKMDGVIIVHLRFPESGNYLLDLMANTTFEHEQVEHNIRCFQYRFTFDGDKSINPFPSSVNFGDRNEFHMAGFKTISPKIPIIKTSKSGTAQVQVKLPSQGIVVNTYHLTKSVIKKGTKEETRYDEYVYAEKSMDIATYYIQCPLAGEYRFDVFARYNKNDKALSAGTSILIQCSGKDIDVSAPHPKSPNLNSKLSGPTPHFYKSGLSTDRTSSTITFENDQSIAVIIKKTKKAFITSYLKCTSDEKAGTFLKKKDTPEECLLTITPPKVPGYYWLEVYASSEEKGPRPFAGAFCIPFKLTQFNS